MDFVDDTSGPSLRRRRGCSRPRPSRLRVWTWHGRIRSRCLGATAGGSRRLGHGCYEAVSARHGDIIAVRGKTVASISPRIALPVSWRDRTLQEKDCRASARDQAVPLPVEGTTRRRTGRVRRVENAPRASKLHMDSQLISWAPPQTIRSCLPSIIRSAAWPTACPPLEQAELMVQHAPLVRSMVFKFIVMEDVMERKTRPLPIAFVSPCSLKRPTCSRAATQLESLPKSNPVPPRPAILSRRDPDIGSPPGSPHMPADGKSGMVFRCFFVSTDWGWRTSANGSARRRSRRASFWLGSRGSFSNR